MFFAVNFIVYMPLLIKLKIFRALMGIIDDYFDGYYSEEMIESQVFLHSCLSDMCFSTLLKRAMVMKSRKVHSYCIVVEDGTFLLIGCCAF